MSRPIAPLRSLALVAALLVSTQAFAAPPGPVKKKPAATGKATSAQAQAKATTTKRNASVKATAPKKAATATAKAPVVTTKRSAGKPAKPAATATAKAGARQPGPNVAAVAPRPEPQMYVPPPLGPERYYPNGIPELRPEFLHPLPGARPQASAQDAMTNPAFSAPQ
jgi:hypothetical protein